HGDDHADKPDGSDGGNVWRDGSSQLHGEQRDVDHGGLAGGSGRHGGCDGHDGGRTPRVGGGGSVHLRHAGSGGGGSHPEQWADDGRDHGDDHGDEPDGSDGGNVWRRGGSQLHGEQRDVDHGGLAGGSGRHGGCDGHDGGRNQCEDGGGSVHLRHARPGGGGHQPEQWADDGRDHGDDHGDEPDGRDGGNVWRDGGSQLHGEQRDVDHGGLAGGSGRHGGCDGNNGGRNQCEDGGGSVHLRHARPGGGGHQPEQWADDGRDHGDDHGDEPDGRDGGNVWRDGGSQLHGEQRDVDHGGLAGGSGRHGGCDGNNGGRNQCEDGGGSVHLRHARPGGGGHQPEQWADDGRDHCDDHGDEPDGRDGGNVWRDGGSQLHGEQRDVDHGGLAGGSGRHGGCDGNNGGRNQCEDGGGSVHPRHARPGGGGHQPEQWADDGRDHGDDHGDEPDGRDGGNVWRDGGSQLHGEQR